eukprot:7269596-Pyramimonas_sp.AAC.1
MGGAARGGEAGRHERSAWLDALMWRVGGRSALVNVGAVGGHGLTAWVAPNGGGSLRGKSGGLASPHMRGSGLEWQCLGPRPRCSRRHLPLRVVPPLSR